MADENETRDGYRRLSLWLDTLPDPLHPRPPLSEDVEVDVAIVGGGFTGLWTAYYLSRSDPSLRIAVVERDICGFGASGRNGGWCIGELAAGVGRYAGLGSHDGAMAHDGAMGKGGAMGQGGSMAHDRAMALSRALFDSVDEVGRVATAEGIDCRFAKGGATYLARNHAQAERQREHVEAERANGFTEDEIRLLSADEARRSVNATDVLSGVHFSAAAAIDPARLVRGLADVLVERGVSIFEQTAVSSIEPGRVVATAVASGESRGHRLTVSAPVVVRATEAYTRDLAGHRRTVVPIYSLMIATEPLPQSVFDEIGLADRQTFADGRYAVIYGQRTADDRLAFGGRGVPYLYGSRIVPATEHHRPTHELIHRTLVELFPVVSGAEITHRWGGVLGAYRNWTPSVTFDRATGLATAGGYVGEGVCAANLAGRTLADLVCGADTELVTLPWVDVTSRKWEPEPLRWLGVWGTRKVMSAADRIEYGSERESRRGRLAARLLR